MKTVQFESEVGSDGFISLRVPLGLEEANSRVIVTIAPLPTPPAMAVDQTEWLEFVRQTYGSCAELGLEEPRDLPLQSVETMDA